mgnify:CR=1 FL=1
MKVILTEDVKSLGKKGEIVNVSDGYARNFILKKNKGVEANGKNLNDLKLKKANDDKIAQQQYEDAQELGKKVRSKLRSRWEKAAKHSVPYLQKRSQKRLKSRWILRSTRRKYS